MNSSRYVIRSLVTKRVVGDLATVIANFKKPLYKEPRLDFLRRTIGTTMKLLSKCGFLNQIEIFSRTSTFVAHLLK